MRLRFSEFVFLQKCIIPLLVKYPPGPLIASKGPRRYEKKNALDGIKQARKTIQDNCGGVSTVVIEGNKIELNLTEIKGRRVFKHWCELVEK